jgi:HlyD family secretion protein
MKFPASRIRNAVFLVLIILVLGGGAMFAFGRWFPAKDRSVRAHGTVEATEVRLSFKISGKLAARLLDEGQWVRKDQVVAILEDNDYRTRLAQAKANLNQIEELLAELLAGSRSEDIAKARANVAMVQARLDEALHGSRVQEIADAKKEVARADAAVFGAESALRQAAADRERFGYLFEQGGISRKEWEGYVTRFETAEAALDQARALRDSAIERLSLRQEGVRREQIAQVKANLEEARAAYDLIVAGPRAEQIAQAKAQVDSARQAVRLAEITLADTRLCAPIDGIVVSKSAEPGEYLQPGAVVLTIVDLEHPWVRAYVTETQLGQIKLDQEAHVTIDADPKRKFAARLSYVSDQAEFTPKFVQTTEERVKLMFRIKVSVENPDRVLKPGMPADVVIAPIG